MTSSKNCDFSNDLFGTASKNCTFSNDLRRTDGSSIHDVYVQLRLAHLYISSFVDLLVEPLYRRICTTRPQTFLSYRTSYYSFPGFGWLVTAAGTTNAKRSTTRLIAGCPPSTAPTVPTSPKGGNITPNKPWLLLPELVGFFCFRSIWSYIHWRGPMKQHCLSQATSVW